MKLFFYFISFLFFTNCDVIVEEEGLEQAAENEKIEKTFQTNPSKTNNFGRETKRKKKVPELTDQKIKTIH